MGNPVESHEVLIHDTYFKLAGPVRRTNFAVTPNPVLFGDTSKAGDSVAMTTITQTDYSGGAGIYLGNTRTDTTRFWASDLGTTGHRALTLPPRVVDQGTPSWAAAGAEVTAITEFNSALWVACATKLGTWSGTAWSGAADRTLAANAREMIVWGSNLYVAEMSNTPYERRTPAGVWTIGPIAAESWAIWDNKLWAITRPVAGSNTLYSTLDGTTWTGKTALVPNLRDNFIRLAVYRDSGGASALYAHTDVGLYIYDALFDRWLATEVQYPNAVLGQDFMVSQQGADGRLYVTNGKMGLNAIQTGNPMVITAVGLDRDDGFPADEDGIICALASDPNFLYALTVGATGSNVPTLRVYRGGWHKRWKGSGVGSITNWCVTPLAIATLNSQYTVFWGFKIGGSPHLYSMVMPSGIYNPRFFAAPDGYQAGPLTHITPWWPFESEVQRKIFGHLFAQAKNHTATETTLIEYGVDLDESTWTALTGAYGDANPIVSDGLKEFFVSGAGAQVKWIRFRFTQQRGGTTTLTPLIEFYTAEIMRVLPATYAYSVEIDLTETHRGNSPTTLRNRIEDLLNPQVVSGFYKFSYQDELSGVRTHYGRLSRESGQTMAGPVYRGQGRESLTMIIPYHRDVV